MNRTLDFYNKNAQSFAESTLRADFHEIQDRFLRRIPQGGRILDFGCGAGRDTKYFLQQGFRVDAADGSEELCRIAGNYTGIAVKKMLFHELDTVEYYHGIWACASILHLPKEELTDVLEKMGRAIVKDGVIYISFKYGSFEGMRNGRYFTDFTEETFQMFMGNVQGIVVDECWKTSDARPNRGEEKWVNFILRKSNTI